MSLFFIWANITMKFLLLMLTRWEVVGRENIPKNGPLMVVSNHLSMVDPPLLGASIPRRIIFMAKEELYGSWFSRTVVKQYGSFPIRRGKLDRKAIKQALLVLEHGNALGVFPEGTRSPNGRLQAAEAGAALIAYRSNARILPVGICGTDTIKGIHLFSNRPHITVTIGKPFTLPQSDGKRSRQKLGEYTDIIMTHIAELLPEKYR